MELCRGAGVECLERDLSLTEVYRAAEVFCTGTMGELAAVVEVDGNAGRAQLGEEGGVLAHQSAGDRIALEAVLLHQHGGACHDRGEGRQHGWPNGIHWGNAGTACQGECR